MKQALTLFCLLIPLLILSQTIERQILPAQGGFVESPTVSVSWTIGDMITATSTSDHVVLTQGFQQPDFTLERIQPLHDDLVIFKIFPNPTRARLTLELQVPVKRYLLEIIDIQGRTIHRSWNEESKKDLDLSPLPPGQFVIRIYTPHTDQVTIYQITKL
ncbi:MAG TPA: T9SS type A sorting domain-containing protein [Membranihabitans sp.]|nr:T9SS type A sorting domain-containing protein [Membranihabitans sp.]